MTSVSELGSRSALPRVSNFVLYLFTNQYFYLFMSSLTTLFQTYLLTYVLHGEGYYLKS